MAVKKPLTLSAGGRLQQIQAGDWIPATAGGVDGAAASTTIGIISILMNTTIITITPTGACTFNATGGLAGQRCTFIITTSGLSSFIITWNMNFKVTGTLATGILTGKVFAITFVCKDGTLWVETGRTVAM